MLNIVWKWIVWACARASEVMIPLGWEDDEGFHYESSPAQTGNPD